MDSRTERLIRADIKARWTPLFLLIWFFVGSVLGFALLGGLGVLVHYLRSHGY
jgi:ABC-type protease/lipase transport system fused ATPase/permease subunit